MSNLGNFFINQRNVRNRHSDISDQPTTIYNFGSGSDKQESGFRPTIHGPQGTIQSSRLDGVDCVSRS